MARDDTRMLIARTLAVSLNGVTDHARLWDDLGADSLDYIELALAIEVRNDEGIPDEEIAKWVTVRDVLNSAETVRV
jgi:acyl carrier protein